MSDQLIQGCIHEWSAENVQVLLGDPTDQIRTGTIKTMVICSKCYAEKPPIDISKPPQGKRILTDSK
jgi:hypothetical protein